MLVITRTGVTTQIVYIYIYYATGATTMLTAIVASVCFLFGARNHIASTVRNNLDSLISNLSTFVYPLISSPCKKLHYIIASHMYMFFFSTMNPTLNMTMINKFKKQTARSSNKFSHLRRRILSGKKTQQRFVILFLVWV